MAWHPLFIVPLELAMYEWEYSGNISPSNNIGRSTSSHFLIRIASYQLDSPSIDTGTGVPYIRDWFNVYYSIAEFDAYTSPSNTPVVGENTSYNPKSPEEHGFQVDTEIYLPYKLKPGDIDNGRFIGFKKLPRNGAKRFYGKIQGYGNPWQFGQVIGSVSSRTSSDDKLLLQVYHWVEVDLLPTIQYTGITQQVYEILTLEPQRYIDIELQMAEADKPKLADALLELEQRGAAVKSAGRKGEYWSLVVPF